LVLPGVQWAIREPCICRATSRSRGRNRNRGSLPTHPLHCLEYSNGRNRSPRCPKSAIRNRVPVPNLQYAEGITALSPAVRKHEPQRAFSPPRGHSQISFLVRGGSVEFRPIAIEDEIMPMPTIVSSPAVLPSIDLRRSPQLYCHRAGIPCHLQGLTHEHSAGAAWQSPTSSAVSLVADSANCCGLFSPERICATPRPPQVGALENQRRRHRLAADSHQARICLRLARLVARRTLDRVRYAAA
jgi:hypothetical protein